MTQPVTSVHWQQPSFETSLQVLHRATVACLRCAIRAKTEQIQYKMQAAVQMAGPWVLRLAVLRGFQLLILIDVQGGDVENCCFCRDLIGERGHIQI